MSSKMARLAPILLGAVMGLSIQAGAGVLKTLDQELNTLVRSTEPYLVTVRGDSGSRKLIATGIVYDNAGHILTSSHIAEATGFNVTFKDGRSFPALKMGADNYTGLAVLKILGPQPIIPNWREAKSLSDGDWVILIGNSFDRPSTISFGSFHSGTEEGFLVLSMNADPGSSGGAILNIDGDIVGVLVAREIDKGQAGSYSSFSMASSAQTGIAFFDQMGGNRTSYAVPFETARRIADQLVQHGKISRGYLGISTRDIPRTDKEKYGIASGVKVAEVDKGSPADSAGLLKGDIIINLDSQPVADRSSLFHTVRTHKAEDMVRVGILRDTLKIELSARLAEAGEDRYFGKADGLSSPVGAARDLPSKGLDGLKLELAQLRAEVDRLQIQLSELKKEIAGK